MPAPDPSAPATQADIQRLEARIDACATKQDLERFATKQDLERFATKQDLDNLAVAMKAGFEEHDRKADLRDARLESRLESRLVGRMVEMEERMEGRMVEMEERLMATLARAVDAATERYLDYVRVANDQTRAVDDRARAVERRLDEHIADEAVHRAPRRRR